MIWILTQYYTVQLDNILIEGANIVVLLDIILVKGANQLQEVIKWVS